MAMTRTFYLDAEHARERMKGIWRIVCEYMLAGKQVRLRVDEKKPTRTLEQNDLMWTILGDIARQVQWPVDGGLQYLEPEDWKEILTAGLRKSQRVARGIEGGFVMLGQRTSRMSISEMSDVIELAYAFGAERGVIFGEARRAA